MLLLLQIFLAFYLIILVCQAVIDAIRGVFLIFTGLTLIAVSYLIKLVLVLIRLCKGRPNTRRINRA